MQGSSYKIDILCKVVDNYGDAGLVWRLARAIGHAFCNKLDPSARLELRILCDDLTVLKQLGAAEGELERMQLRLFDWQTEHAHFDECPADFVIETFGCKYPAWYEALLYDPHNDRPRKLLNLEYLTAETWAEDYHLLASPSRIERLKKTFFMPGFRKSLGGLIFDRDYLAKHNYWADLSKAERALARIQLMTRCGIAPLEQSLSADVFWLFVFSYTHDYTALLAELVSWEQAVVVVLAAGQGSDSFLSAMPAQGADKIHCFCLPFVPQQLFDELILAADFNLVRGEESMSRAALAGKPFLWHCYPLVDDQHLNKVAALADQIAKQSDGAEELDCLKKLWLSFNRQQDRQENSEDFGILSQNYATLLPLFERFAQNLLENGDCATKLVDFLWD